MNTFTYQNWKKRESEQRIINALSNGDKTYSELLNLTELSKPILGERLKSLEKQGKTRSVAESKTKRFLYHLRNEKLDDFEKARILIYNLSMLILGFLEAFADDNTISDKEYSQKLLEGINVLLQNKMYEMIAAPLPEQEEWIRNFIGPETAKRLPKLFYPKNRSLSSIREQIFPQEQALFKSKDVKKASKELLRFLSERWEKIMQQLENSQHHQKVGKA